MTENTKSAAANQGDKMIEVRVRFRVSHIVETEGDILPKHCWSEGIVYTPENASHGIQSGEHKFFRSLAQVPQAIEEALTDAGVQMHVSEKEPAPKGKGKDIVFGLHAGQIIMHDDFDDSLPDEFWTGE